MPSYLIETYLARGDAGELAARGRRASSAADELTREQAPVSFEQSIHLPKDELCFFVFSAPTCGDAARVAQRAGLDALRIVEAVASSASTTTNEKRSR
jgi:hypothetical protein